MLCSTSLQQSTYAQSSLSTLDPDKSISQYILDHWNTEDGLPQNSITTILQTANGYLWFGTEEGLVRFNGASFKIFDKSNTYAFETDGITSLAETRDETLWIGTRGGGLIMLSEGKFSPFAYGDSLSSKDITTLFVDSEGSLWIGTYGGGIMKFQSNSLVYYNQENGIKGQFVSEIVEGKDKSIWIGTEEGLFYMQDGSFNPVDKAPLDSSFISTLFNDTNNQLWIGTEAGEIYTLSEDSLTKKKH